MDREMVIDYLANVSKYLKMAAFCRECGISNSNLSQCLIYKTYAISDQKLFELYALIKDYVRSIA